eukprot:CAMPEP_0202365804 /NCGR_PEP_ID=MMETSP1126-20121109/16676_1 /ASSEMBLY_ACC=CAM_ASM_000457 /TAXON_ID=3047 /ORGANISM="Dunaliella tertiolecta, Strain CCMP1320" /LENGTH=88 /DNA_ID=CAMNT_0048960741 /DNA_START=781 /DNA_END=1047 /DNA_ORIENTATION=-
MLPEWLMPGAAVLKSVARCGSGSLRSSAPSMAPKCSLCGAAHHIHKVTQQVQRLEEGHAGARSARLQRMCLRFVSTPEAVQNLQHLPL